MAKKKITCFIPFSDAGSVEITSKALLADHDVKRVVVITSGDASFESSLKPVTVIKAGPLSSTAALKKLLSLADTEYIVLYTKPFPLDPGEHSLQRMMQVCSDTGASMVYSGYYENKTGTLSPHPVIDYQEGSLRDDFNFGSLLLFRGTAFRKACRKMDTDYAYAGLYDLRLKVSQYGKLVHIPELLYTEVETDTRKSGEKQFDYVDPRNRAVQIEMENACTDHLKKINGWLRTGFRQVRFDEGKFENEASVIIPVRNRVKTIGDAIRSVLSQEAPFRFNLIIVDNHSTDGTTDLVKSFSEKDSRVVHIIPERNDLGIGGCWNKGIFHPACGKFAIQLDSDDLYIDNSVVKRIVDAFYSQNCAMVVGSYKMVNFNLEDIPPGLIDHREWTPDNGRNNALRINGLGAPRAFYTPVLRTIRIPNVSYGEDYAVGLAISRHYQIGRIYEPLYLCRRWDENSDASLDVNRVNAHNLYKDRIRTIELLARKKLLKKQTKKL